MYERGRAQRADAGHPVEDELRQRLSAQGRAAGAEHDNIRRARGEPLGSGANRRKVILFFRQPQQRQRAVGMAGAQAVECALRALEHRVQGAVGDAMRTDVLFERAVDGLNHRHR